MRRPVDPALIGSAVVPPVEEKIDYSMSRRTAYEVAEGDVLRVEEYRAVDLVLKGLRETPNLEALVL